MGGLSNFPRAVNSMLIAESPLPTLVQSAGGSTEWCLSFTPCLQFINLQPTQQVECYLIIQDLEERFNEGQIEELLQLVQDHLSSPAAGD